jgi:hypothetical protein
VFELTHFSGQLLVPTGANFAEEISIPVNYGNHERSLLS